MADGKMRILLLRRDRLNEQEVAELQNKFPGMDFEFRRSDALDFEVHAFMCQQFRPDLVILPKEKPIPAEAMEKGFKHVTFTPKGLATLTKLSAELQLESGEMSSLVYCFVPISKEG